MKVELRSLICARWEQIAASGLIKWSIYLQFLYFPAPSFIPTGAFLLLLFFSQNVKHFLRFFTSSLILALVSFFFSRARQMCSVLSEMCSGPLGNCASETLSGRLWEWEWGWGWGVVVGVRGARKQLVLARWLDAEHSWLL